MATAAFITHAKIISFAIYYQCTKNEKCTAREKFNFCRLLLNFRVKEKKKRRNLIFSESFVVAEIEASLVFFPPAEIDGGTETEA